MGLFEWLGEGFNPGPVGDVDAGAGPLFDRSLKKGWAVLFMSTGFTVFGLVVWLILKSVSLFWPILVFIFYLLIAYFLTPRADTRNVGWAGGLIDHPFRISDDANRLLVLFYLFLLPGKLILFAVQTAFHILKKPLVG